MEASNTGQDAGQGQPEPEQTEEERQERQAAQDAAQPGDQGEQAEQDAPSAPPAVDQSTPVATSAPDPSAQSGTPLAEEREAGAESDEGEADEVPGE